MRRRSIAGVQAALSHWPPAGGLFRLAMQQTCAGAITSISIRRQSGIPLGLRQSIHQSIDQFIRQ